MARNRRAVAKQTAHGFEVHVQRTENPRGGFHVLHVRSNGEVFGLPGNSDDRVLVLLADVEIRAAGWPSIANRMLRWFDNR